MHTSIWKLCLMGMNVKSLVQSSLEFNPLRPDIKMHILITDLHTFLMELLRRICLNIKTSYPQ